MTEKMKTAKQMGIPKGFTLKQDNKDKLVRVARRQSFLEEATKIRDMEWKLFEDITSYLYPQDKLDEFWELQIKLNALFLKDLPSSETKGLNTCYNIHIDVVEFMGGGDRYDDYFVLGKYSGWGSARVRYSCNNDCGISPKLENPPTYSEPFSHTVKRDKIPYVLSSKLQRRLKNFVNYTDDFKDRVKTFEWELSQVLNGYSSMLKLCNTHEEFIGWSRRAEGLKEDPGGCSDIPMADSMQTVRKLMKG